VRIYLKNLNYISLLFSFFISCADLEQENNIAYSPDNSSADILNSSSLSANIPEKSLLIDNNVLNQRNNQNESSQVAYQNLSNAQDNPGITNQNGTYNIENLPDDQNNSGSQNQNGTESLEELIEKLTTGNVIQESDYDLYKIPDANKIETDQPFVIAESKGKITAEGVFSCVAVMMYALDSEGNYIMGMLHSSASGEEIEKYFIELKDMIIKKGGIENTIETYLVGGFVLSKSPSQQDALKLAGGSNQYNIKEVKFNIFETDPEKADSIGVLMTGDKKIYYKKPQIF
jgi:hypothetical protein